MPWPGALNEKRLELLHVPRVRVDKTYAFDTEAGSKTLKDLFDGRLQLIAAEPVAAVVMRFVGEANSNSGSKAQLMALKQLMGMVRQQAAVMSYADVFLVLTVLFVALAALSIIMKKPTPAAVVAGH